MARLGSSLGQEFCWSGVLMVSRQASELAVTAETQDAQVIARIDHHLFLPWQRLGIFVRSGG